MGDNREAFKDYANPIPWFGTAPEALLQGFAKLPEIEVHVVSCIRQPVTSPEKIAPNIFFHSLVVPKIGWMRTLFQGCVRAARKKIRELQPDIVHGQGTEADCALSAVYSGFPNVLTLHGNMRLIAALNREPAFSYNWLAARLEGWVLPRTGGVVCITHYTRAAVKSLARRTWVLPNAVEGGFFDVKAGLSPATPPVILCVGVICRRKNQNDFIRALDPLARQKNFRVRFIGQVESSPYGDEFRQLLAARPWCEHVPFSGRDRVKEYFQTAALVALPTREDNCPMVVLEAMAAGVPVLASNVGGVPDLIQPEVNGLLCDPDRPETFSAAVTRLLDDHPLAARLAAAGRAQALNRFHPRVVAQQHVAIYREVIGKAKSGNLRPEI